MSDYGDGNFMDMVSSRWAPPPSTSLSDNGLNPISDIFLQTNQSKQRPGLVDRVAARIGRNIPPIRTDNLSPCAVVFKDPKTVPFGIEISPGLSPSVMLQSRSQVSNNVFICFWLFYYTWLLSYDRYLNIKILRNSYVCFHIFFILSLCPNICSTLCKCFYFL